MIDDLTPLTMRQRGSMPDTGRVHARRAGRLLETCTVCGTVYDVRTQLSGGPGRYCSTTCLATAQRIGAYRAA